MRHLSLLEARVLAVLVEKELTVPDSYPLSLNSLTLGCNQKTARDPVMQATDGEVQVAIDGLRGLHLVFEASGSRVTRYEHNMGRVLAIPSQSVALLATLMLRGPQTASELRASSERLHRFADLSSVEGFLEELANRAEEKGGPLAMKLPRAPGSREARWAQRLTPAPDLASTAETISSAGDDFVSVGELAAMKGRLAAAEAEILALRTRLDRLCAELDVPVGGATEQP